MKSSRLSRWLPALTLTLLTLLVAWQRQNIYDWWKLRGYTPPMRVVQLADNTTMNSGGRRLFYVHHPVLEADKKAFRGHCPQAEESIVLGCYVKFTGIYIYDVKEPRLNGIHEVTAAHELLHAAYDRLRNNEKQRINKLLSDFFATVDNPRIKAAVESYRKRDPSIVANELHSIVGTEIRAIPIELEQYYKRYFDNRQKIVEFSEQYEQAFEERENRLNQLRSEIDLLKVQIEQNDARLQKMSEEIRTERARLDSMLAAGDTAGYNAAVPGYNARIRSYNALLAQTNSLIRRVNGLITEHNQLAAEEQELINALDSRLD